MWAGTKIFTTTVPFQEVKGVIPMRIPNGKAALIKTVDFYWTTPDTGTGTRILAMMVSSKGSRENRLYSAAGDMFGVYMTDEDAFAVSLIHEDPDINEGVVAQPQRLSLAVPVLAVCNVALFGVFHSNDSDDNWIAARVEYDLVKIDSHKEQVLALRQ